MNILLVSHHGVAGGLKKAVDMITGEQEELSIIELTEAGVQDFSSKLESYLEQWKRSNKKIVILADLKGGTPYNQTVALTHKLEMEQNAFVISGVNLPLVLETLFLDETDFMISDLNRVIESSRSAIFKADPLELNNNDLDE